jgi:hypothetical protein
MEWLSAQLNFMRERNMKAILIGHVPPAWTSQKKSWDETFVLCVIYGNGFPLTVESDAGKNIHFGPNSTETSSLAIYMGSQFSPNI